MCINQCFKKILFSLFITSNFLSTAYADLLYQAVVEKGDVLLSVNNEKAKSYKQGESIKLDGDALVCFHSGEGSIALSGVSAGSFTEVLSEPFQCQSTPLVKGKRGWFSKAKKVVAEVGKENLPVSLALGNVKTSLITLGGEDYFLLENSSWHKNKKTLPLKLQLIGGDDSVVKEYLSHHKNTTLFLIPKKEIESKNAESLAVKIVNSFDTELLQPTRFSLKPIENGVQGLLASRDNSTEVS